MQNKPNLIHLLVVPLITVLACNGLTTAFLWQITGDRWTFLKSLCVVVMLCYGLYLRWLRNPRRGVDWNLVALGLGSAALIYVELPPLVWLAGMAILFSIMRFTLLKEEARLFFRGVLVVLAGLAVAVFLAPASLAAAVSAFVLVQLIYEMRIVSQVGLNQSHRHDRFKQSLRTAERILEARTLSRN